MIRKVLVAAFALLASISAQAEVWQARYGVAEIFNFKLYNADGTLDVDEVDGGTEVSLSCNEGAQTTATNDFVDEGDFYSISLTAAELQCERLAVVVAATTTEVFFVQTIGNASAFTPLLPADTQQVSGDATAADNLELAYDDTAGAVPWIGIVDQGTAQSATGTTVVLRAASAFADDTLIGRTICALGSTQGYWQCAAITDSVLTSDTVTVPTWTVTPSGTITYKIWGTAAGTGSVTIASGGITAASFGAGAIDAAAIATGAIDADAIAADAIGASEIAANALGSSEIASAAIDADAIATDALGAAEIAADAGTELGTATWATTTRALTILDEDSTTMDLNATAVGSVTGNVGGTVNGLTTTGLNGIRDLVVEDQGSISLGCAIAAILAVDAGDVATTGGNSTFEEASGTETRVTSVVVTAGNRTTTITCPTYP